MRPCLHRAGAALLLALASAPGPAAGLAGPPAPWTDTGERFRFPATRAEFRVLRDPASGRKALEGADGRLFASVEAAVLAEEAGLSPLRRAVAPPLWAAVEDPSRADEPLEVILVLRSQPVHDVAREVRARTREELAPRLARLRAILGGIAGERERDGDGIRQVGDLLREERGLLDPEEREELRAIRGAVKDAVHAMRREVLAAARPRASREQDGVAAAVAAIPGASVRGRSLVLSAVAATVPAGRVRDVVEGIPAVALVLEDARSEPCLDRSIPNIGAKTWWDAGYDGGSGVGVGVFDTGVDDAHPALSGRVVSKDFSGMGSADDDHGHGTHIAGIIGSGDATYRGVAPGCTVFNGRSGVYYIGNSAMMQGGDWAADNGCDVFSNSIGSYGNSTGNYSHALYNDAASAEIGVSVAAAAGNYGFTEDGLAPNSTGFNGFCVSGYSPGYPLRANNVFWDGSSHGPCSDGRRKPDIAAPFVATSCDAAWEGDAADFVQMGGTSMAAPHVAGALALLYDHGASWTPEGMKALLLASTWNGSPTPSGWDYGWGWGALDVGEAFANRAGILESSFTSSGATAAWLRGPALAAGEKVALCWNRQVTWNDGSAPTSYKSLVDLDLEVYGTDGSVVGAAGSLVDSVERVATAAAVPGTWIKVTRAGAFPSGQSDVDWALATAGGAAPTAATAPSPASVSLALEADAAAVRGLRTVTVAATLANAGGAGAFAPRVTLGIPQGFTLESGDNPQDVASVPGSGGTATATWVLRAAAGPGGTRTFTAGATFSSFGTPGSAGGAEVDVAIVSVPSGTAAIAGGAAYVAGPFTTVHLVTSPGDFPVTSMRVRNAGDPFGPWTALQPGFLWSLAPGSGDRTVEVQVRDSGGVESDVFSDSVFSDTGAPTGSFVLSGGREYLMPWEALTADWTADDGDGSGVDSFRVRWAGAADWLAWIPVSAGPSLPLPRPDVEALEAEGAFRDRAGIESAASAARIRLVPAGAPDLAAAKSFRGILRPGGAGGSFRIGVLPDDLLTVRLSAGRGRAPGDLLVDLWSPAGERVSEGRYPEDGRRAGIDGYPVAASGDHWVVVRPAGEVPPEGIPFRLGVRVRRPAWALHPEGYVEDPDGDVEGAFDAVQGMELRGRVRMPGPGEEPPLLVSPAGGAAPLPGRLLRNGWFRIERTLLEGGNGLYRVRMAGPGALEYDLRLRAPRRVRMAASDG